MPDRIALVVIDMINTFDFPRGPALLRAAKAVVPRLARLKSRVKAAGGICVYANDNFADWNSDFQTLVALAAQSKGACLLDVVSPSDDDPHILKPRHSAFHQTALDFVLNSLNVRRVLVAGISTESCVLATALDAHIRDLDVQVVSDCVASSSPTRRLHALSVLRYCEIPTVAAAKVIVR